MNALIDLYSSLNSQRSKVVGWGKGHSGGNGKEGTIPSQRHDNWSIWWNVMLISGKHVEHLV